MADVGHFEFSKFRVYVAMPFCFPVPNFSGIGQSAAEFGQKRFFLNDERPPSSIFKNVYIWSSGCHRVVNVLLCSKFNQNLAVFRRDVRFNDLQYGGRLAF